MKTWHYASNQFEVATRTNYKKAHILIADHYAKLDAEKADADIEFLFNRFAPVKTKWDESYSIWISADGTYQGETKRFEKLITQLSSDEVPQWEAKVRIVFGEKTSDYKIIFPDGRGAFRDGNYDRRISEVNSLAERLKNYAALSDLQKDVQKFYELLFKTRNTQQSKEDLLSKASDDLEALRLQVTTLLYANLGRLMDKYASAPTNVERFYQLSVMRKAGVKEEGVKSAEPPAPEETK